MIRCSYMKYQIWTNETISLDREYMASDGYRPGAHMKLAYTGDVPKGDPEAVLERLFEKFNIDHPADYHAHSLSVGDVIVLVSPRGREFPYACESIGFALLIHWEPNNKNAAWLDSDTYHANPRYYEMIRKLMHMRKVSMAEAEAQIVVKPIVVKLPEAK